MNKAYIELLKSIPITARIDSEYNTNCSDCCSWYSIPDGPTEAAYCDLFGGDLDSSEIRGHVRCKTCRELFDIENA